MRTRGSDRTPERLAQAESALQNAARLRPDAPETHLARATTFTTACVTTTERSRNWRKRGGLPNDPRLYAFTGYILRRHGKAEERCANLERAVALDPGTPFPRQLTYSYGTLFRYADQAATMDRVLAITPDDALKCGPPGRSCCVVGKRTPNRCTSVSNAFARSNRSRFLTSRMSGSIVPLLERDSASAQQALAALGDDHAGSRIALLSSSRHFAKACSLA